MADLDDSKRQCVGFMACAMKVPADFDSMGREQIEMTFAGEQAACHASEWFIQCRDI